MPEEKVAAQQEPKNEEKQIEKESIENKKDKAFQWITNIYNAPATTISESTFTDFISNNATKNSAVNGNINISSISKVKDREIISSNISKYQLSFIESVFVKPENYPDILDKLNKRNVLLLYGEKGIGKFTASIKLLYESGKRELFVLQATEVDYNFIKGLDFKNNTGYILNYLNPNPLESLNINALQELESTLEVKKSQIVIILDKRVFAKLNSFFYDLAIEMSSRICKADIIRNHLYYYVKNTVARNSGEIDNEIGRIDEILDNSTARKIIESLDLERGIEISNIIISGILDKLSDSQIIGNIEASMAVRIENFLEDFNDVQEKLFAIALAFFESANYAAVIKAFGGFIKKIYDLLPEKNKKDIDENKYAGIAKSKRLSALNATLFPGKDLGVHPPEAVECIKFNNPRYAELIIEHVWREYDFWHERLLEWLFEFDFEYDYYIQDRITYVLGIISKYDFEMVNSFIIEYWVKSSSQKDKISAAKALNYCSEHEQNQLKVYKLLNVWASGYKNQNYHAIVLYAYAGAECSRFIDLALIDIGTITNTLAEYDNFVLENALSDCMSRLFRYNQDNPLVCGKIIDFFFELLKIDEYLRFFSKSLFIYIFERSLFTFNNKPYPCLLLIFAKYPELRSRIADIWIKSLSSNHTRKQAMDALRSLIKFSDSHKYLYNSVENFIVNLIKESSLYQVKALIDFLEEISKHKPESSYTSSGVLKKLAELMIDNKI